MKQNKDRHGLKPGGYYFDPRIFTMFRPFQLSFFEINLGLMPNTLRLWIISHFGETAVNINKLFNIALRKSL